MNKNIKSVRGMKDLLPEETVTWQRIENTIKQIVTSYGYNEIRFPIVEQTVLFKHAIGNITDVVEKEMYTFKDRSGDSLTLRPEGTAGCVRAGIQHGLLYNQEQRLWYIGPMFRYERPQKGRYRQFNQLGIEAFGLQGPDIDAELIIIGARLWNSLGIIKDVSLELNSSGSVEVRDRYCNALVSFLEKYKNKLDEDCKRRIYSNPLRILDSKNPEVQELLNDAPTLEDYLDRDSREHFVQLCNFLEDAGVTYTINQRLIRGLDYYNRTVFEWVTNNIGSQNTFCAGGRYDSLVKLLGGNPTPAVGFAIGLERLILLINTVNPNFKLNFNIDIFLVSLSKDTHSTALKLSERIHDSMPDIKLVTNCTVSNLKKQFTRAKKYGASVVLILNTSKIKAEEVIVKDMLSGRQVGLMKESVIPYLYNLILKKN